MNSRILMGQFKALGSTIGRASRYLSNVFSCFSNLIVVIHELIKVRKLNPISGPEKRYRVEVRDGFNAFRVSWFKQVAFFDMQDPLTGSDEIYQNLTQIQILDPKYRFCSLMFHSHLFTVRSQPRQ